MLVQSQCSRAYIIDWDCYNNPNCRSYQRDWYIYGIWSTNHNYTLQMEGNEEEWCINQQFPKLQDARWSKLLVSVSNVYWRSDNKNKRFTHNTNWGVRTLIIMSDFFFLTYYFIGDNFVLFKSFFRYFNFDALRASAALLTSLNVGSSINPLETDFSFFSSDWACMLTTA